MGSGGSSPTRVNWGQCYVFERSNQFAARYHGQASHGLDLDDLFTDRRRNRIAMRLEALEICSDGLPGIR